MNNKKVVLSQGNRALRL